MGMPVPWTAKVLVIAIVGAVVGSILYHCLYPAYLFAYILVSTALIGVLFFFVGAFDEWKHVDLPIYAVTNRKGRYIIHHVTFDEAYRHFMFHSEARKLVKTKSANDLEYEVIQSKGKRNRFHI